MINGLVALCGEEDVLPRLSIALKALGHRAWHGYGIATEREPIKEISTLRKGTKSKIALGCCLSQPIKKEGVAVHGSVYHPEDTNLVDCVKKVMKKGLEASEALSTLDADFAFGGIEDGELYYGRDPLGVRPLYVGRDLSTLGVATEAKALRAIGLASIEAVPPGSIHRASPREVKSRFFRRIKVRPMMELDVKEASEEVLVLLSESVRRRTKGLREAVVAFSGGLDSALLAQLASRFVRVRLLSVFCKKSKDEAQIVRAAEDLGLELEKVQVGEEQVKSEIGMVRRLVESDGEMDLAIGLAFHFVVKRCSSLGSRVLFLGQMADELFGGYDKYARALMDVGEGAAQGMMMRDVFEAHKNNFERDDKATSPYVTTRLPYASIDLVEYALSLPLTMKVGREGVRKGVLREAALKAGLPRAIIEQPKRALQYSTGLQALMTSIIRRDPS